MGWSGSGTSVGACLARGETVTPEGVRGWRGSATLRRFVEDVVKVSCARTVAARGFATTDGSVTGERRQDEATRRGGGPVASCRGRAALDEEGAKEEICRQPGAMSGTAVVSHKSSVVYRGGGWDGGFQVVVISGGDLCSGQLVARAASRPCTGPAIQSNQIRLDAGERWRFIVLPQGVSGDGDGDGKILWWRKRGRRVQEEDKGKKERKGLGCGAGLHWWLGERRE